jgi:hypothetical protein
MEFTAGLSGESHHINPAVLFYNFCSLQFLSGWISCEAGLKQLFFQPKTQVFPHQNTSDFL